MKYKTNDQYKEYDKATALVFSTDYHVVALIRTFYYQQGIDERMAIIKILEKRVRLSLKEKNIPKKYWNEAVELLYILRDDEFEFLVRSYRG